MVKLTGTWSDDFAVLTTTHAALDSTLIIFFAIFFVSEEMKISRLECSPLSSPSFCDQSVRDAALEPLLYVAAITVILTGIYSYLFNTNNIETTRDVFIWNVVHIHFLISFCAILVARGNWYLLPLPVIAILQDLYSMARATLSEEILKAPATAALAKESMVIWGCLRMKKESSRFFMFRCC